MNIMIYPINTLFIKLYINCSYFTPFGFDREAHLNSI